MGAVKEVLAADGAAPKAGPRRSRRMLRVLAVLEVTKGVFAGGAVAGLLLLLHRNHEEVADRLLALLHVSPDRHFARLFLVWAAGLDDGKLAWASGVVGAYASLRFVEAYGLWMMRAWGEWVALVSASFYLPFELYEFVTKGRTTAAVLFVVNLAIVAYLAGVRVSAHLERRCGHP